jgi:hypothetical protein
MSVLAMLLTAAMVIPGNGPERVSGETEQSQGQRVDISGSWEGIAWSDNSIWKAEVSNCSLVLTAVFGEATSRDSKAHGWDRWEIGEIPKQLKSGKGKLIIQKEPYNQCFDCRMYEAIYRWDSDLLVICFSRIELGSPTSFQAGKNQFLVVLRRVKPNK